MAMNIHIVVFRVAWWLFTHNTQMSTPRCGTPSPNLQTSTLLHVDRLSRTVVLSNEPRGTAPVTLYSDVHG
jgi:hypothetical protein